MVNRNQPKHLQPPRWQPKYRELIRFQMAHPGASLKQLAAAVGYSRGWVGRVVQTSEYRMRFRAALGANSRRARRELTSDPD